MKRGVAVFALVILVGSTAPAFADAPKPTTTGPYFGPPPWLKRLAAPAGPKQPPSTPAPRDPAAEALAERALAQTVWDRRMAVCDKLRVIAQNTNDEELLQAIDRYEQEAFDLYLKATAHLPCSRSLPIEERLDRQLQEKLPTTTIAERLEPVANTTNRTSTVSSARGGVR